MSKFIDLENTNFKHVEFVRASTDLPFIPCFFKSKLNMLPDFGTIVIGLENISPKFQQEFERVIEGPGPVFTAPAHWRWANIAKALGVHRSASQARKNGWDGSPEPGFNFRICRINKIRGEILVLVVDQNSPWAE